MVVKYKSNHYLSLVFLDFPLWLEHLVKVKFEIRFLHKESPLGSNFHAWNPESGS